jgi:hypothetical protein
MDEQEDETRATFDALRESVAPTVDVDSGLADLHGRARRGPRGRRAVTVLGAAAVVIGLVVGGVAVLGGDSDRQVVSHGGEDLLDDSTATTAASGPEGECDDSEVFLYMVPTASEQEVETVDAALARSDAVESFEFVDRAETFEEFQRLFADSPQFVRNIRPEDLPQSFRATLTAAPTDAEVRDWEAMPGVLRVEFAEQYACEVAEHRSEIPTGFQPLPIEACGQYGSLEEANAAGGEEFARCAVTVLAVGSSDGSSTDLSVRSGDVRSADVNDVLGSVGLSPMVPDAAAHPDAELHLVRAAAPTFLGRSMAEGSATDALVIVMTRTEQQDASGTSGQGSTGQLHLSSASEAYRALESLLAAQ